MKVDGAANEPAHSPGKELMEEVTDDIDIGLIYYVIRLKDCIPEFHTPLQRRRPFWPSPSAV